MDIDVMTLCDYAQDALGKLTIVGTFDTIFAQQMPFQLPAGHIAIRFRYKANEAGKAALELKIVDPEAHNVIPPVQAEMDLQKPGQVEYAAANIAVGITGIQFNSYGKHSVVLAIRGQKVRTFPFFVSKPPQAKS